MIDGKKIIEIRRAGFINKGAELMLYAILQKLKSELNGVEFAMAPSGKSGSAPYLKRANLCLFQKAYLWKKGIQFGTMAEAIPKKIREMYGIITDNEVDVVIDAAGFAYSDQIGKFSCWELANAFKRLKKKGAKTIILPQAFGPFESKYNKTAIRTAVYNADIVFARDDVSYEYLVNVVGERKNVRVAPDFTNLIKGVVPSEFDKDTNKFCIVPNYRMVDKTKEGDSEAYLPFMIEVTQYAYSRGQRPFILVHEGDSDLRLAEKIRDAVSSDIQIIREDDPLKIKGILSLSTATVGSRFHGLVSALSQGVPALATGWSHKYQKLFDDYGFTDGVLSVHMSKKELHNAMETVIDESCRGALVKKLTINGEIIKMQAEDMWCQVIDVINS